MKKFLISLTLFLGMCLVFPFAVYQEVNNAGSDQESCFYVSDISVSILKKGKNYFARATITIMDNNYFPVPNAAVYVTWSGVVSGTDSGVTGPYGTVTFTSPSSKSAGPFYITVDYVTHPTMPPCYI